MTEVVRTDRTIEVFEGRQPLQPEFGNQPVRHGPQNYRAAEMIYRWVIRPILFRLEPERAHRLTIALLKILQRWIEFKWFIMVCFMCFGSKWKVHTRLGYVRCPQCRDEKDEESHVRSGIHGCQASVDCVDGRDVPGLGPVKDDVNVVGVDPAPDAGGPRGD